MGRGEGWKAGRHPSADWRLSGTFMLRHGCSLLRPSPPLPLASVSLEIGGARHASGRGLSQSWPV